MSILAEKELIVCPVHSFCTIQGIQILKNDHNDVLSDSLNQYIEIINRGNSWCDGGLRNIHHFYHPNTKNGIMGLSGADNELHINILKAQKAYRNSSLNDFFFNIGSALHLIQDLCVPHHSTGYLLRGHNEYENWVLDNYSSFSVFGDARYDFNDPLEILEHNAQTSIKYTELIFNASSKNKIEATRDLLGLAQRTTASFLYLIYKKIIQPDSPPANNLKY